MSNKITFSPVTRLSGLLSVEVTVDNGRVVEADAKSTMFRGYEKIMEGRNVIDAVYMTQRVCGICSLAHGAVGSYLLDELYANTVSQRAQYLRNIMYIADFLQNHIRHFYIFSLPDYVKMPNRPPFQEQDLTDARLKEKDNQRLVEHYFTAVEAAQEAHQILALFGGKAPHQHSFVHGGVSVAPTADKINQALALVDSIEKFVSEKMLPDARLLSKVYRDYFEIGVTPRRLISFGLFKFGAQNEECLLKPGVVVNNYITEPEVAKIEETVANSWFEEGEETEPAPDKPEAYSWTKTVQYEGQYFETGPLARLIINGDYQGKPSTMDRILARAQETLKIARLMKKWLREIEPGSPPISQQEEPIKEEVVATTDAMRGALLHKAKIENGEVTDYNIITPTAWNFSPKDEFGNRGPVEGALVGTKIPRPDMLYTVLGRIIRSFDPCISCATHVLDASGEQKGKVVF